MSAAQVTSETFGGKLAKLGRMLGIADTAGTTAEGPAQDREAGSAHLRRESERRKKLYDEIGGFLFAHDLDLTPLNFGLAMDYITGNDLAVEKAVGSVLKDRGKITNGVAERIMSEQRVEQLTPDALSEMLKEVEINLVQLTGIADQSSNTAKDFGAALQREAAELTKGSGGGEALSNLVVLTRTMIEKTREVEAQMRDGQQQTQLLQKNLETARRAAEQDHLTGLPNRRSFEGTLYEEVALAREAKEPLSVAFCDIDHFKVVNDTHGHDAGDRVLKFVAGLLAKISGDRCHVARHGGEEFVMLFRGLTVAESAKIVDDARSDMAERNLVDRKTGERMDQVTFSGGVADVFAYAEPREALKAADRALYLAKEHGRNRVYIAAEAET